MSSGRSSEDREDDNDEVENAAALAAASMTSLIYQDLLTAMRDDASVSVSGRGGRYRHPHPSQQPMSLQGSRMGSYGRIDGSRKSALQNEIRSVEVTFLFGLKFQHHKLKFPFKIFWLLKETPPKSKFAINSISRSKQSHFFNSLFPSRANRFGYPVYPERELGIPSRTGPVSFAGFSPSVASSVARDQLHMTSILIPLFYPHPMCANSQKLGLFVATPDSRRHMWIFPYSGATTHNGRGQAESLLSQATTIEGNGSRRRRRTGGSKGTLMSSLLKLF